jgi:hypothetical protein
MLERINPAVIAEMGLSLDADGVVVSDPGDIGGRVGLRRGDILRAVNRRAVTSPSEAADLLSEGRGRYELLVVRGNRSVTLRFRA